MFDKDRSGSLELDELLELFQVGGDWSIVGVYSARNGGKVGPD